MSRLKTLVRNQKGVPPLRGGHSLERPRTAGGVAAREEGHAAEGAGQSDDQFGFPSHPSPILPCLPGPPTLLAQALDLATR